MNLLKYIKNPITGNDILNAVDKSVSDNELILKDIQDSQWERGEDKLGRIVGRYKKITQTIAESENPPPNKSKIWGEHYNLDWTGDLKRNTFVETRRVSDDLLIRIDSSSYNKPKLFKTIKMHGDIKDPEKTLFGYQPKKKDAVVKIITKSALKKLKNKLK